MTAPRSRDCRLCAAVVTWKPWGKHGDGLWVHYSTTGSIWCTNSPTDASPVLPNGDHKRPPEPPVRPRIVAGLDRDETPERYEL